MATQNEIIIPLSKTKLILLLFASIAFVVAGAWFFIAPENFEFRNYPPTLIKGIGLLSILFFGTVSVVAFRKFFQTTPGLILNDKGITDATSAISLGLIKRKDIKGVRRHQVMSTKILLIDVANPENYINQAKNNAIKRLLKLNHKEYGTPVSINSQTLKMNFDELEKTLKNYIG